MTRQVISPPSEPKEVMRGGFEPAAAPAGDSYSDRLLKLIPGETVAVYLAVQGILESSLGGEEVRLAIWLWALFAIIGVLNILYMGRILKVTDTKQYVFVTLSYAIWVLSIGGPFRFLSFYEPFIGAVILTLFTFAAPMFYNGVQAQ